ncbi:MAG: dihydropteroate synthase [Eubacterium sp.]
MIIGNKTFDTDNNAYIMGILNVTPDSFSDGGRYNNIDAALLMTEKMIAEGASVIDVGGESTRPGYKQISDEEEIGRTVPIIEAIKSRFDIPVSLDTYKGKVALAGIDAGADMINDIWGLKYDSNMARIVSESKVSVCIMHNRSNTNYVNYIQDVIDGLQESIDIAYNAGIDRDKIMIDPGVGFAKSYEQNLAIIHNVDKLKTFGLPVMMAASRKSVIGNTLGCPVDERVIGTTAITAYGMTRGCSFFRVHDVKENMQVIRMIKAIICEER